MANHFLARQQWTYAAVQTDSQTLATVDTTNYFSCDKIALDLDKALIPDPSITGSRQAPKGVVGKATGTFSLDLEMRGAGTTLTAPQFDPLLEAIFGAPIDTGVYSLSDTIKTLSLYRYRLNDIGTATGPYGQIGVGATVTDATFTIGQNLASMAVNGKTVFTMDSTIFSTLTTAEKFGLSAFPAAPTAPTSLLLQPTVGFEGSIVCGSDTIADLNSMTIKVNTGNSIVNTTFGTTFGSGTQGNTRSIEVTMTIDDSDSTGVANLRKAANSKVPFNITATVGNVAGNIFEFALVNVQSGALKMTEASGGRMQIEIASSMAVGDTLAGLDALTLTCL